MSSTAGAYRGKWTDWEDGSIMGMRITLSSSSGQILLAAIALFVGICGLQSWSICRLLLHQLRSATSTEETIQHNGANPYPDSGGRALSRDSLDQGTEQLEESRAAPFHTGTSEKTIYDDQDMQFILRNSTPFEAVLRISKLSVSRLSRLRFRSRVSSTKISYFWAALIILVAILNLTIWPIAAVFSSLVARTDYPVLVSSPNCGIYLDQGPLPGGTDQVFARAHDFNAYEGARIRTADEYIQSCYHDSSTQASQTPNGDINSPLCRRFVTRQIPWTAETNVTCPFPKSEICREGPASAFGMDTGYLDSHDIFGINTPPDQRILYRRKTVCSPLATKEYTKFSNGTLPGEEIASYNYGGVDGPDEATFLVSTYGQKSPAGYTLRSFYEMQYIPDLNLTEGKVTLYMLIQGSIGYLAPVDDPMFAAHRKPDTDSGLGDIYYFDKIASAVACVDQHQICNPKTKDDTQKKCTPLSPAGKQMKSIGNSTSSGIGLTDLQRNISYVLESYLLTADMYFSVAGRDSEALLASRTVFDGVNIQLPNNQWTKEVSHWFNIALVRLQFALLEYATGPAGVEQDDQSAGIGTRTRLNVSALRRIYDNTCVLQKVGQVSLGEDYLMFNVLGLALIIALGGFILVLGVALEVLIENLPKHGWGWKRREAWISQDRFVVWAKWRGKGARE